MTHWLLPGLCVAVLAALAAQTAVEYGWPRVMTAVVLFTAGVLFGDALRNGRGRR